MRPGHHRPLGTTTWHRFPEWHQERQPQLGDVFCEASGPGANDEEKVRRAYLVVGVVETRTGWRILGERVEFGTLPESLDPEAIWGFFKLHR